MEIEARLNNTIGLITLHKKGSPPYYNVHLKDGADGIFDSLCDFLREIGNVHKIVETYRYGDDIDTMEQSSTLKKHIWKSMKEYTSKKKNKKHV